jgi:ankyrin repeat protein
MAESPSSWWTRVEGLFGRSPDSGLPDKPVLRGGGGRVGNGSDAALLQACTVGSKEGVEQLLLEGASPNHRGEFGATPLTIAAELGSADIVALLLAAGAEVDTIDDNGDSALLCACRVGQVDGRGGRAVAHPPDDPRRLLLLCVQRGRLHHA